MKISFFKALDDSHADTGWEDREIEYIDNKLSSLHLDEQKKAFIGQYIHDENLIRHNIIERLGYYATTFYYRKAFSDNHPEMQEYEYMALPEDQKKELGELNEKHRVINEKRIEKEGVIAFFESEKNIIFPPAHELRGNMAILNFLHNESKILDAGTPREIETGPTLPEVWREDTERLRKHLEALHGQYIQYDNADAVMSGDERPTIRKRGHYKIFLSLLKYWHMKELILEKTDFLPYIQTTGDEEAYNYRPYQYVFQYIDKNGNRSCFQNMRNNNRDDDRKKVDDLIINKISPLLDDI